MPCPTIYFNLFFLIRGCWTNDDLQRAIEAYRNGDIGLNKCAATYGIPKATLKRHFDNANKFANGFKKLGRSTILPADVELEIHNLVLKLEAMFFGMSRKDKWYYKFLTRFPDLCLRQPEATSMSRASIDLFRLLSSRFIPPFKFKFIPPLNSRFIPPFFNYRLRKKWLSIIESQING